MILESRCVALISGLSVAYMLPMSMKTNWYFVWNALDGSTRTGTKSFVNLS